MPAPIDIAPAHLEIVRGILRAHVPRDVRVWVFGSRATWTAKEFSDLDLALEGPGPTGAETMLDLAAAFEESALPWKVDLLDMHRLAPGFRAAVEKQRVPMDWGAAVPVEGWRTVRLADACYDISYGYTASASDKPVGPKFLRITDITKKWLEWNNVPFCRISKKDKEKYLLKLGDIVIARTGSLGANHTINENDNIEAVFASYLIRYRVNANIVIPNFVGLQLKSSRWKNFIDGISGGSVQPGANAKQIGLFELMLPPIAEQKAIAEVLSSLDDKIELNRRMNETLEAMARAIFRDWFVDFGPTRRQMQGATDPAAIMGHAFPAEKTAALAPLFPATLNDDGLPEGWKASLLGDRIDILDSKRIPLSSLERKRRQGPYPYHGATGVMDYIDNFLFEGIHVLLGEDGSVVKPNGKPFTQYVWGQFWVNNHAHVLRGSGISNEMLLCFLQQIDIAPYVTGAVQPKLNQKSLKAIPFPACSSDDTGAFANAAEPIFAQVRQNADQAQTLAQTRDLLLPNLMSGEIRLAEAEKAVEAVA